jgi:hypothetical protein
LNFSHKDSDYDDFQFDKHAAKYFDERYKYRINAGEFTLASACARMGAGGPADDAVVDLEKVGRLARTEFIKCKSRVMQTVVGWPEEKLAEEGAGLEESGLKSSAQAARAGMISIGMVTQQTFTYHDGEVEEERHINAISLFYMSKGRVCFPSGSLP